MTYQCPNRSAGVATLYEPSPNLWFVGYREHPTTFTREFADELSMVRKRNITVLNEQFSPLIFMSVALPRYNLA